MNKNIYDWIVKIKGKYFSIEIPEYVKNNPEAYINSPAGQEYAKQCQQFLLHENSST